MKNYFFTIFLLTLFSNYLFANSINIVFSSDIKPVCGIEILKPNGNINFRGINIVDEAKFLVRTNSLTNTAKVNFTNIVKSQNIINENGYFKLNKRHYYRWKNLKELTIQKDLEQTVSAHINKNSNQIEAGEASISTILQISCD